MAPQFPLLMENSHVDRHCPLQQHYPPCKCWISALIKQCIKHCPILHFSEVQHECTLTQHLFCDTSSTLPLLQQHLHLLQCNSSAYTTSALQTDLVNTCATNLHCWQMHFFCTYNPLNFNSFTCPNQKCVWSAALLLHFWNDLRVALLPYFVGPYLFYQILKHIWSAALLGHFSGDVILSPYFDRF